MLKGLVIILMRLTQGAINTKKGVDWYKDAHDLLKVILNIDSQDDP